MTAPAAPAPERAARWEDFLEIFIKPSAVFERRRDSSFWVPFLVLVVLFVAIYVALKGAFQPIMDAEMSRGMARAMAKNPQFTEEMAANMRGAAQTWGSLMVVIGVPVAVFFIGIGIWISGKIIRAAVGFGAALMIASYSYFPRVIELLVSGAQALLLPEEQLTGRASTSLGAARALDPDSTSAALMATLLRVDVFTLWITFLIAVGLRVVGRVPMSKALLGAGIVYVLGGLLATGLAGMGG
ncbi:MAG TPA: YIP1 family protein [Gemmatimonadales bacterium]|nr:YIP1 family protein [Gemmatimonadales bacterium]